MQLQNRKTNSGNRPPNVINFVVAGGGGSGGGDYYCRRKNSNQLQIPSCLVSVTVANYQWTLCYSFTSCATQRMDRVRRCRAWQDGGRERAGERGGREERERKTKQDTWRWDCRKVNSGGRGRKRRKKGGRNLQPDLRCTDMKAHTSFIQLI